MPYRIDITCPDCSKHIATVITDPTYATALELGIPDVVVDLPAVDASSELRHTIEVELHEHRKTGCKSAYMAQLREERELDSYDTELMIEKQKRLYY